jgi:hypothetical protein
LVGVCRHNNTDRRWDIVAVRLDGEQRQLLAEADFPAFDALYSWRSKLG